MNQRALIVIDVQNGFLDEERWGQTSNRQAEDRVRELAVAWREAQAGPVVLVRHDSESSTSPLRPGQPGNDFMPQLNGVHADLLVTKQVNSAFYGSPDLHNWLQRQHHITDLVICGIQTNMCVETTARMAGNLGYAVTVPLDATRTFDITTTLGDGTDITISADELMRATAASLHGGGFATVTDTASVLQTLAAPPAE
ncbi:MAG: cysteine hydrolase family protein [Microbacteriaceae bacterium]